MEGCLWSHRRTFNLSGQSPPPPVVEAWHKSILARGKCHILSRGVTLCRDTQAAFQTGLCSRRREITYQMSCSATQNIKHMFYWPGGTFAAMETFSPLRRSSVLPLYTRSFLCSQKAFISNANNYKNQTMSAARSYVWTSVQRFAAPGW